ncbi:MAG: hypothetical protein NZV14_13605 [Bryobacteraceae bacterium]|nr:hypothetical protein [Bryobacteraceae bacterium]MDW8379194.1 hypothetical protein [Bryobacterales bacterium]
MSWLVLASVLFPLAVSAQQNSRNSQVLYAFPGKTPTLDGRLEAGEWEDATQFFGVQNWVSQFSPTTDDRDLSLHGYVKHDGKRLYFAFDVVDDVLYGIDTPRWLPDRNPQAHELSPQGWPWFGDEIELLVNAANKWEGDETAAGNGASWQMVCNLTKSRLGGVGIGGLLEGEPRTKPSAWQTYQNWIETRAMECVAKPKPTGKGYIMEWAVSFNPCLEVEPGKFYSPELGNRAMGLNIAIGDLDEKERGEGNFANFHHENWFAGAKDVRTQLRHWGTLWIMSDLYKPPPPKVEPTKAAAKNSARKTSKSKTSSKRSTSPSSKRR